MGAAVPVSGSEPGQEAAGERERMGRLLGHAFPLGQSGSFTGLLEAIRNGGSANEDVPKACAVATPDGQPSGFRARDGQDGD